MAEVIWSPSAKADLHRIHDRIAGDSPFYAQRFVEKVGERVHVLDQFPLSGGIVPEFSDRSIRQLFEGDYRIIYSVRYSGIGILRIFHSARLLLDQDLR